jgi:nucleolar protein 12
VDEVVALDPVKLKFAKRKLRVTRCKTDKNPSSPKITGRRGSTSSGAISIPGKAEHPNLPKPKGDPKLGERLKGMSKEERREAKKQDANRLARRMEKKKARISLEKSLKKPEKERIRVRKATMVKTAKKKPNKRTPA